MNDKLKELINQMTRKEFIDYCIKNNLCPDDFGLSCFDDFSECGTSLDYCRMCIEANSKELKFKEDV